MSTIDLEKNDGINQGPSLHDIPVEYPEGGLSAWLVVVGSFMAITISLGLVSSIGIFQSYLSQNQLEDYSESAIAWIFGIYVFFTFFCSIQIGPLFDAYGPKPLVLAGGICSSVGMMTLGLCHAYWHFMLAFGVLMGIGTSLLFTPAFAAMGHFFYTKRGTATGIAATGGSLGGIVFPLMLRKLFWTVGFAWASRIMGFIFMVCSVISICLLRSRLDRHEGKSILPDLSILMNGTYLLTALGIYFMEWALFVPITYLSSYSTATTTLPVSLDYELIVIMNTGSSFGRWASGYISDKAGNTRSMTAALGICTVTTASLWLSISILDPLAEDPTAIEALVILYALVFGFASGSNISLAPVCVGRLCDTKDYGRYHATCYTVVSFGTLTGIPIAGALIQATGGRYWAIVSWTFGCYVIATECFVWAMVRLGRSSSLNKS